MNADHDLHDERISRLYKMGDGTEPPENIDAEIKQAARIAASSKKRSYAWPSLATAAVLVLSISLVLKVLNQQPLEDSAMEPLPADKNATAPALIMQENKEKAMDRRDKEEPKLEKYRLMKRKVAPAPGKPEAEGAVQLDAAPEETIGEAISSRVQQMECSKVALPDTDSKEEWIKQYQQALEQGQVDRANCIKQAFQSRFNQAMPEPSK